MSMRWLCCYAVLARSLLQGFRQLAPLWIALVWLRLQSSG
jgi:hypothetical protein